jgi:hypothetical protein
MASITYWNRVEARPRGRSIREGLAAQVRDPLWFLTRQWQLGEFHGEDAASPAYVQYKARFSPIDAVRPKSDAEALEAYDGRAPFEALLESEAFTPDLTTAVELGRRFERLLDELVIDPAVKAAARVAFPIPTAAEVSEELRRDPATVRFLDICGGRSVDGIGLFVAAEAAAPALPAALAVDPASETALTTALDRFRQLVAGRLGRVGNADAVAWDPERLEYRTQAFATAPGGERIGLDGSPGIHGDFDWYAFDQIPAHDGAAGDPAVVRHVSESMLPARLAFSGFPQKRYWAFENSKLNFADVHPDRRELGKMLLLDFMLVSGHDWFQLPFRQEVGSLVRIDALFVHDVFGGVTAVERADVARGREGWTLFSTSVAGDPKRLADYFVLPPSTGSMTLPGTCVEELRFFRDENANLVWAVEHTLESPTGTVWQGRERSQLWPALPPPTPATDAALTYRLQTSVPGHWIPFVPVQIDAARRAVALERASLRRETESGPVDVLPAGRILQPSALADPAVYRVREEEISRSGLRVLREVRYSRWLDGSSHLWIARARRAGSGEGSSGLRFDWTQLRPPTPG